MVSDKRKIFPWHVCLMELCSWSKSLVQEGSHKLCLAVKKSRKPDSKQLSCLFLCNKLGHTECTAGVMSSWKPSSFAAWLCDDDDDGIFERWCRPRLWRYSQHSASHQRGSEVTPGAFQDRQRGSLKEWTELWLVCFGLPPSVCSQNFTHACISILTRTVHWLRPTFISRCFCSLTLWGVLRQSYYSCNNYANRPPKDLNVIQIHLTKIRSPPHHFHSCGSCSK